MTTANKLIALASLVGFIFLFFGMPQIVGVADDTPVEECRAVGARLRSAVAINPEVIVNRPPGTMIMPPVYWASLSESEKRNLVGALATQSACASDGIPMFQNVEVRSSDDNRLLGSGTVRTFSEE